LRPVVAKSESSIRPEPSAPSAQITLPPAKLPSSSDDADSGMGQDVEDEAHRQQGDDLLEGRRLKGEADQAHAEYRACRKIEYPMGHGNDKCSHPAEQPNHYNQRNGGNL